MQNPNQIDYAAICDTMLNTAIIGLSEAFPVRNIICWGMTADNKESTGCFVNLHKQTRKHYFLLVITYENTRLEHVMQQFIGSKYASEETFITVVAHGYETINDALLESNHFFTKVLSEGYLMYSDNGQLLQLDYPVINGNETLVISQQHYAHRYHMAEGFLLAAKQCIEDDFFNPAVFMLHQCAEQACIALMRVYTNYRSNIHNLSRLLDLCSSFSAKPREVFSKTTEDQALFDVMQKSYKDARYKDEYQLQRCDAEGLFRLLQELLTLTKTLCEERIAQYRLAIVAEQVATIV